MSLESRVSIPVEENPFVEDFTKQVDIFLKNADYYSYPEAKEFNEAFTELKNDINNPKAIRAFQKKLTQKFIADIYQESSHTRDYLVKIYKSADRRFWKPNLESAGKFCRYVRRKTKSLDYF